MKMNLVPVDTTHLIVRRRVIKRNIKALQDEELSILKALHLRAESAQGDEEARQELDR